MKEQLEPDDLLAFTQGKEEGFIAVYKLYYQEIRYFTFKMLGSKEESEDITTEIFLKLFKIHERFTTQVNIKAFLYASAKNSCIDHIRKVKRRKTIKKDFSDTSTGEFANEIEDVTVEHAIIETVMIKEIYEAVEGLPDKCRQIFKMLYYEGLKPDVIAHQLSITPETVRSQKRHALELLRVRLSDNQMALAVILTLSLLECGQYLNAADTFA
ncbi:RNA polymerase sigma factor [Niastella caeni]|nr:RNA polymerase sigma-70 factor [Niastella caeni]